MRVCICEGSRAKRGQASCCLRPPFLGTPLARANREIDQNLHTCADSRGDIGARESLLKASNARESLHNRYFSGVGRPNVRINPPFTIFSLRTSNNSPYLRPSEPEDRRTSHLQSSIFGPEDRRTPLSSIFDPEEWTFTRWYPLPLDSWHRRPRRPRYLSCYTII